MYECLAWTVWAGFPRAIARGEPPATLSAYQHLVKPPECPGAQPDGNFANACGPKPNRKRSSAGRFGARRRGRWETISYCLSRRFSATTARMPPGPSNLATVTIKWMAMKTISFRR